MSLLFSESHFPTIDCADRHIRDFFADLTKETRLNQVMTEAAIEVPSGRLWYSCACYVDAFSSVSWHTGLSYLNLGS